jgi:hypothetical protein
LDYETLESLYKKAAWVINKLILINKKKKVARKEKFYIININEKQT